MPGPATASCPTTSPNGIEKGLRILPGTQQQYIIDLFDDMEPSDVQAFLKTWNEHVRMSPDEFAAMLAQDIEGNFRIRLIGDREIPLRIDFEVHGVDDPHVYTRYRQDRLIPVGCSFRPRIAARGTCGEPCRCDIYRSPPESAGKGPHQGIGKNEIRT